MADGDSPVSIRERLLKERRALLDLSASNRLLNTPLRTRNNRAVEIIDEKADQVFRLLNQGKAMSSTTASSRPRWPCGCARSAMT